MKQFADLDDEAVEDLKIAFEQRILVCDTTCASSVRRRPVIVLTPSSQRALRPMVCLSPSARVMQVANLLNYNLNQQFADKLPHDEVIQRMKNGMLCYNIISHGMPKVIAPSARAAQDFEVRTSTLCANHHWFCSIIISISICSTSLALDMDISHLG